MDRESPITARVIFEPPTPDRPTLLAEMRQRPYEGFVRLADGSPVVLALRPDATPLSWRRYAAPLGPDEVPAEYREHDRDEQTPRFDRPAAP